MEERHSPFEKVFCLKGKITYVIDKEEFLVNEGECIEISSFRLHESKAGEHGAQLLVMLMKNQYFENFFEN